jgi:hypothetical protein
MPIDKTERRRLKAKLKPAKTVKPPKRHVNAHRDAFIAAAEQELGLYAGLIAKRLVRLPRCATATTDKLWEALQRELVKDWHARSRAFSIAACTS